MLNQNGIFILHDDYEKNYHALQNLLNDFVPPKNRKRMQSGSCKGMKRKITLVENQNCKCIDCNYIFEKDIHGKYPTATVEHVIPYRYGSNRALNSEFLCQKCNNKRELCRDTRMSHVIRYFGTIE